MYAGRFLITGIAIWSVLAGALAVTAPMMAIAAAVEEVPADAEAASATGVVVLLLIAVGVNVPLGWLAMRLWRREGAFWLGFSRTLWLLVLWGSWLAGAGAVGWGMIEATRGS